MKIQFNDGMTLNTSGPLRVVRKRDGFYVLGEGTALPVDSRQDGKEFIAELKNKGVKND